VHEHGAVVGSAHDDADGSVAQAPCPHLGPGDEADDGAVLTDVFDELGARFRHMSIFDDVAINNLDGSPADLATLDDKAVLIVNVASKCGLTPQYEGLEKLHESLSERGFTVLGVPCNQFLGQEPGSAEEIQEFCSTTYGVTFPLTEKVEVNGDGRHPLYDRLTPVADAEGHTGDIRWNFEKFLVAPGGEVVARFNPTVVPEAPELTEAIEKVLPG
jgi:glutathione peroxidase